MPSTRLLLAASSALAIGLGVTSTLTATRSSDDPGKTSATYRRYGGSAAVGKGRVRSYVLVDKATNAPTEIGVAFDERALEGLPTDGAGHHGQTGAVHQYLLSLPTEQTAPFKFVEVNWNPMGHEPDGVYQDVPHFDFHFYTVSKAERDAIVPSNSRYAAEANNVPTGDFVPAFALQLGPPGAKPADVAVPLMGVHWIDTRAEELQKLLGKPDAYRPFTRTFILGSWNGRFHFWEPMITRAHILAKKSATDPKVRDEVIPLPVPKRYQEPGHYPTAYRITWDAKAREYRIALTGMTKRA
jgi:Domain of unknown function (DUF5602)